MTTPDGLLAAPAAARRANRALDTFNRYRQRGRGPAYVKIGGRIFYRIEDVDRWAAGVRIDPEAARRAP